MKIETSKSLGHLPPCGQDTKSAYYAHYVRWANDHDIANLQAKMVPKSLILSELTQ